MARRSKQELQVLIKEMEEDLGGEIVNYSYLNRAELEALYKQGQEELKEISKGDNNG